MKHMEEAAAKLAEKLNEAKRAGRYANAVANSCAEALKVFAGQDEEFAQAIAEGDFSECMKTVEKKLSDKSSVSDLEVYQICAGHYFPGAKIRFEMVIQVNPFNTAEPEPQAPTEKHLDLSDFI